MTKWLDRGTSIVLSLAIAGLLALGQLACFSERAGIAGPIAGECAFAIDGGLLGSERTLIAIHNFRFVPASVTVDVGTTVTWVNCEPAGTEPHTTTADEGEWSSFLLDRGQTFSHTFSEPATYSYHCVPHPSMVAEVVVEE